jgi:hypothetical protein
MRYTAYVILFFCIGCNQPESALQASEQKKDSLMTLQSRINYTTVLAKFKMVAFDTLAAFSPGDAEEEEASPYIGIPMDSIEALVLFPGEAFSAYGNPQFFAVYRFEIDTIKTGLLVRAPSHYGPSAIKLLVFNKQKNGITDYGQLADSWGDGGYIERQKAWLFKTAEQELQCFVWMEENNEEGDNDSDTAIGANSATKVHHRYALLDLSGPRRDTITTNSTVLLRDFGHLLTKTDNINP